MGKRKCIFTNSTVSWSSTKIEISAAAVGVLRNLDPLQQQTNLPPQALLPSTSTAHNHQHHLSS